MQRSRIEIDCARSGIKNRHVLAALSGGADSVALVFLLNEKRKKGEIRLTLAHFEHGIRSEESKLDQAFVIELAKRLDLPLITESASVPEIAEKTSEGIETCARRLRHEFLHRAKDACGADFIATAHHKSDQAETVLMHLLRGGGITGAKGMRETDGIYVRPLLKHSKDELIQYLLSMGETWREDNTNFLADNPRNCLRLNVMPRVKSIYPGAEDALLRFSEIARDEDDCMREQTIRTFEAMTSNAMGVWTLWDIERYPKAIIRRVIRMIAKDLGFDDIEKARNCLSRVSLSGGWQAVRRDVDLYLIPPLDNPGEVPLSLSGKTVLEGICEIAPTDEEYSKRAFTAIERLNPDALSGAVVRTRRDGDFMRPLGMGGKKKLLSDIMTDRKIPLPLRDRMPVVAKGAEVLWIITADISESVKTDETTGGISLKAMLNHTYGG